MAAGLSTRFKKQSQGQHKLLAQCGNSPLTVLETTLKTVQKAFPHKAIFILTNVQEHAVTAFAKQLSTNVMTLKSDGLSTTIAAGIHALKQKQSLHSFERLFILPADLPFIRHETLILLQGLFEKCPKKIIRPAFQGISGHPVGFHHTLFSALETLSGDEGAKALLQQHPIKQVSVLDPGIAWDIDTPEDFIIHPGALAWYTLDADDLKNRA